MDAAPVLALAEEPGLWLPPEPKLAVREEDGFAFVRYGRDAWIHRVRLGSDDVAAAVGRAAEAADEERARSLTWWLGELSTPPDIEEQLLRLGLERDEELTTLTVAARPAGKGGVAVRLVETYDDLLVALELDWSVFGVPEEEREVRRRETREAWPALEASGRVSCFVAELDGRAVGMGRVVFTPAGGVLMGGATLPEARGRGVYTSLVHARWQAAVERGTPRLTVAAGAESGPILERLGFARIGKVQLLRQPVETLRLRGQA
jgi:GNAT superfamily N-acetyltransferase